MRQILACALAIATFASADNSTIHESSRDDAHLLSLYTVGGTPVNLDDTLPIVILVNHGYAVGYSEDRRNPLWAIYKASELTGDSEAIRYERSNFFALDARVGPAVDGRTFGDGFDRGHMVPNAVIGNQYGSLAQMAPRNSLTASHFLMEGL